MAGDTIAFEQYTGDPEISDTDVSRADRGFYEYQKYVTPDSSNPFALFYINTCFGNLIHQRKDFTTNDVCIPVNLFFTYNSGSTFSGRYSNKWQMSYNIRYVTNNKNKNVIIQMPDDRTLLFVKGSDSLYHPFPFCAGYVLETIPTGYKLTILKDNLLNSGNYSEYIFDSLNFHYITAIVDRNHNTTEFEYGNENHLRRVIFPSGKNLQFDYKNNLLSRITYRDSLIVGLEYPDNRSLTAIYADSSKIYYSFDDCGFLTSFHTTDGKQWNFRKDDSARYTFIAIGNDSLVVHYGDYNACDVKNFNASHSFFTYDTLSRITSYQLDSELVTNYTWNDNYLLTKSKTGERIYAYDYDKYGFISKITYPDNSSIQYSRDSVFGLLIYKTDQLGNTTTFQRDNEGNLVNIVNAKGDTQQLDYTRRGLLNGYTLKDGNKIELLRDDFGNIYFVSITAKENYKIKHDNFNRIIELDDPLDRKYFIEHGFNYIQKISNDVPFFSYRYDSWGNLKTFTNNADSTNFEYDALDRLTKVKTKNTSIYSMSYVGNKIKMKKFSGDSLNIDLNNRNQFILIDAAGFIRSYRYNIYGELSTNLINGSIFENYTYDQNSRLSSIFRNGLNPITYSYNKAGQVEYLKNTAGLEYNFEYDKGGNLSKISSNIGYNFDLTYNSYNTPASLTLNHSLKYIFNSDIANRITDITSPEGYYKVNHYDLLGNLASKSDFGGNIFTYDYNPLYLVSAVHNPDGGLFSITRDNSGNIKSIKDETGNTINITHPALGTVNISYPDGSSKTISKDLENKIIQIQDEANNYTTLNYDILGRIKSLSSNYSNNTFTYSAGKITESINATGSYVRLVSDKTFRPNNFISSEASNFSFSYDSSLLTKGFTTGSGNIFQLNFDQAGRLIDYTNRENNQTVYAYDTYDRIIRKINSDRNFINYRYLDESDSLQVICNNDTLFYNFDQLGRITYFKNYYGIVSTLNYDFHGNLISYISGAQHTSLKYNLSGLLTEKNYNDVFKLNLTYEHNALTSLSLNGLPLFVLKRSLGYLPQTISLNNQNLLTFQYQNNLPVKVKDQSGIQTEFKYNEFGELTTFTLEDNKSDNYFYDNLGKLSAVNFSNGIEYINNYNANGQVQSINFNDGNSIRLAYNSSGNISNLYPSPYDSISFKYNSTNQLTMYTNENSVSFSIQRNWLGSPESLTLPDKLQFDLNYRANEHSLVVSSVSGDNYTYKFDDNSRLTSLIAPSGYTTAYQYDGLGNLLSKRYGTLFSKSFSFQNYLIMQKEYSESDSLNFEYSPNAVLVKNFDINGLPYGLNYDGRFRINSINSAASRLKFFFTPAGSLARMSDSAVGDSYFTFIAGTLPVEIKEFGNLIKNYHYNSLMNVDSIRLNNRSLYIGYDNRRNIKGISANNFINTQLYYDNALNPILWYPLSGRKIQYFWRDYSKLDSSVSQNEMKNIFEYDKSLFAISSRNPQRFFVYTSRNSDELPIKYEYTNNNNFDFSVVINYNSNRQINKISYPGNEIEFDYQPDNKLNIHSIGKNYYIKYNRMGYPLSIEYPNGYSASYSYNNQNLPIKFVISNISTGNVTHLELYAYYPNEKLKAIVSDGNTILFTRDSLGRIVKRINGIDTTHVIYDLNGNLLETKNNDHAVFRIYDPNSELTALGDHMLYSYNQLNEIVSKTDDQEIFQFEYDNTGRLQKINGSENGERNLIYDNFGNLLLVSSWDSLYYIHLPSENPHEVSPVLATLNGRGELINRYDAVPVKGGNLILGESALNDTTNFYYFISPFGNSAVIMDDDGNSIAENPTYNLWNIDSADSDRTRFMYINQSLPYYSKAEIYFADKQPVEKDSKRCFAPNLKNIAHNFDLYSVNSDDFINRMPKIGNINKPENSGLKLNIDDFAFALNPEKAIGLIETKDKVYHDLITKHLNVQFNNFSRFGVQVGFSGEDKYLKDVNLTIFKDFPQVAELFANLGHSPATPVLKIKLPEWIWDPYIGLVIDEIKPEHFYHKPIKFDKTDDFSELKAIFEHLKLPEHNGAKLILEKIEELINQCKEPVVFSNIIESKTTKIAPEEIEKIAMEFYNFPEIYHDNFNKTNINNRTFETIKLINHLLDFNRDYTQESNKAQYPFISMFPTWEFKYDIWEKDANLKLFDKIKLVNKSNIDRILSVINSLENPFINPGKLLLKNNYIELPPMGTGNKWLFQLPVSPKNGLFQLPSMLNQ